MVMKLQIFLIKKFLKVDSNHTCLDSNHTCLYLHSALKKDECKYIKEKVCRHINDNLSDFSYFNESDVE